MNYKSFNLGDWIGHISGAIEDERELDGNEMRDLVEFLSGLPKWIPCSERLPEDGQHVMVTFGGKIAFCLAQDNNGALTEITSLISKDANVLWLYPEDEWGDGYEAWMPLPSPYKVDNRTEQGLAYADQDTMMPAT